MIWLIIYNWLQLVLAAAIGAAGAWFVMRGTGRWARRDLQADIATARLARQGLEAERAKLRAEVAELSTKLQDARRRIDALRHERVAVEAPAPDAVTADAQTHDPSSDPSSNHGPTAPPTPASPPADRALKPDAGVKPEKPEQRPLTADASVDA